MKAIVIASKKSTTITTNAGKVKPVYLISFADKLDDEQKACVREHGVFSRNGHWYIGVKNAGVAWVDETMKKQTKTSSKKKSAKKPVDYNKYTKAQLIEMLVAKH